MFHVSIHHNASALLTKDAVVEDLCAYFRLFWPTKAPKRKAHVVADGYAEPATSQVVESEDSLEEVQSDLALAEALGVPRRCIDKMTPSKSPSVPSKGPLEHGTSVPLSAAEQRARRIQELKFFGLMMYKSYFQVFFDKSSNPVLFF